VLSRGKDGAVRSFINVCRHRGSPVVTEDRGSARRFVCPYHAWTYNLDGSLASVNAAKSFGTVDARTGGLVELPCAERDGIVWGVLTPAASIDLDAHLGELGTEIAKMQLGSVHHGASRRATAVWRFSTGQRCTARPARTTSRRWTCTGSISAWRGEAPRPRTR
jgi:phenylpropionate dioxygenase-like ring-hydroxylating dioxygenase large terminal subunit